MCHRINTIFLVVFVMFLSGCATIKPVVHMAVDSIRNNASSVGTTSIIISGTKEISPSDLQFKEFVSYVARAITSKGYTLTDNIDEAETVIFLVYGIGDPNEHYYTYSLPVWGQTGVSSSTTYGTINTLGNLYSYGNNANLHGTTNYSSTTTYTPQYGVVGSTSHVGSFVTYTRYIFLHAYDLKRYRETNKLNEVWKTDIVSTGSSGDLRRVFPVLIAGAAKYIGENTGQQVNVELYEDSKEVLEIKGIQLEQKMK